MPKFPSGGLCGSGVPPRQPRDTTSHRSCGSGVPPRQPRDTTSHRSCGSGVPPRTEYWSGPRELNPHPQPSHGCAPPLSLSRKIYSRWLSQNAAIPGAQPATASNRWPAFRPGIGRERKSTEWGDRLVLHQHLPGSHPGALLFKLRPHCLLRRAVISPLLRMRLQPQFRCWRLVRDSNSCLSHRQCGALRSS